MINAVMESASLNPMHKSSSSDTVNQPVPVSPTSTDGWGELENGIHEDLEDEKNGWDDIEPLDDPKPSPVLANIQAAQKRPVMQPKPQGEDTLSLCISIVCFLSLSCVLEVQGC